MAFLHAIIGQVLAANLRLSTLLLFLIHFSFFLPVCSGQFRILILFQKSVYKQFQRLIIVEFILVAMVKFLIS